jgi:DNA-binding transcriptional LysR family regulator
VPDWSAIDLRQLAALVAVAEERSVSRAAVRLGYTQSAVSQQLRALERIVGAELLVRSPGARTVELSDAGRRMLHHARAIRERADAAREDLGALSAGTSGVVRLGSVPSAAAALVPGLVPRLRRHAPQVELRLDEDVMPERLLERLRRGALDLVLAPVGEPADDLAASELLRDPYVLAVPAADPLARLDRPLEPADLQARELVGKDCGTPSQRLLEAALEDLGVDTTTIVRAHDRDTVHGLVARGVGIAVIPRLLADPADGAVRLLPLSHLLPDRRIALFAPRRGFRPRAAELVSALLRHAEPTRSELAAAG